MNLSSNNNIQLILNTVNFLVNFQVYLGGAKAIFHHFIFFLKCAQYSENINLRGSIRVKLTSSLFVSIQLLRLC